MLGWDFFNPDGKTWTKENFLKKNKMCSTLIRHLRLRVAKWLKSQLPNFSYEWEKKTVSSLPEAMKRNALPTFGPLSDPAFSAIKGYGSLTWGWRKSSQPLSARTSQHSPNLYRKNIINGYQKSWKPALYRVRRPKYISYIGRIFCKQCCLSE